MGRIVELRSFAFTLPSTRWASSWRKQSSRLLNSSYHGEFWQDRGSMHCFCRAKTSSYNSDWLRGQFSLPHWHWAFQVLRRFLLGLFLESSLSACRRSCRHLPLHWDQESQFDWFAQCSSVLSRTLQLLVVKAWATLANSHLDWWTHL